jgi:hypothetical protein
VNGDLPARQNQSERIVFGSAVWWRSVDRFESFSALRSTLESGVAEARKAPNFSENDKSSNLVEAGAANMVTGNGTACGLSEAQDATNLPESDTASGLVEAGAAQALEN